MASHGLILFAHGARDPRWVLPFEQVAARVRALRPGVAVTLAYLELMPPNLQQAGQALVETGCRVVTVLPFFLGAGGHVRKDLPAQLELLRKAHPAVQWHLEPAAGESELLIEALVTIATESTDKSAQSSTGDDQEPA